MVIAEISLGLQVTDLVLKIVESSRTLRKNSSYAQMKNWERILKDFQIFLRDAEEKQSYQSEIRLWLSDLHRLTFKVEDVLEDLNCEATRRHKEPRSFFFSQLDRMKFGRKMAPMIDEITAELANLKDRKQLLNLTESGQTSDSWNIPPCGLMAVGRPLHGRQQEESSLMKAVLSDGDSCEPIGVIPIYGMGGLGKTTLARHVYDSSEAKETFSVRAWFAVSQDYDLSRICKGLLENFAGKCLGLSDMDTILRKLYENLNGKKYLIVIDDLWNEKEADWSALKGALWGGSTGSKIIVTTRNESVAIMVRTTETLMRLEPISDEECWSVFCDRAGPDAVADSEREKIGRELVRRCHGVPLYAALLGGALLNTHNLGRWKDLLREDSNPKKDMMSVMMNSYNDLSSELKRCFSVFAMFPEDHKLSPLYLILIWLAEGMVKWENTLDYIGIPTHRYYDEFKRRSLLSYDHLSNSDQMHDMVRNMACEITGKICCTGDNLANGFDSNETRRLYVDWGDERLLLDFIRGPAKLRTMMIHNYSPNHHDLNGLFLKMKYLRTLIIEGNSTNIISEFPESIAKLAHLRYLSIRFLEITSLPESIGNLHNLEILELNCRRLLTLPSSLRNLKNLKILEVFVINIPDVIGYLSNLEYLRLGVRIYRSYKLEKSEFLPSSIGYLNNLKGICFYDLDFTEIPDSICNLLNLESLEMTCLEKLEKLPLSIGSLKNLKSLEIIYLYKLEKLPLSIGFLKNLKYLKIYYCPKIVHLPESVGLLSNLNELKIMECKNLEKLPSSIGFLKNLKKLKLCHCPNIKYLSENIKLLSKLEISYL